MNDHHALITQLCDELDHNRRMLLDDRQVTHPLADRARAVLDRPEPERLTDDKLMDIARATGLVYYMGKGGFASRYQEDTDITAEVLAFARAVLAADGPAVQSREPASVVGEPSDAEVLAVRPMLEQVAAMGDCIGANTVGAIMAISDRAAAWLAANPPGKLIAIEARGCPIPGACSCVQPAPPAEGEVAELVADLRGTARGLESQAYPHTAALITRAADLLEQRHPAPAPVSERLPGPEDCDAEGRVWLYRPQTPILNPYWDLVKLDYIDPAPPTHWLPATALPLPASWGGDCDKTSTSANR